MRRADIIALVETEGQCYHCIVDQVPARLQEMPLLLYRQTAGETVQQLYTTFGDLEFFGTRLLHHTLCAQEQKAMNRRYALMKRKSKAQRATVKAYQNAAAMRVSNAETGLEPEASVVRKQYGASAEPIDEIDWNEWLAEEITADWHDGVKE